MHDDELVSALRARALDPDRRLEAEVSAFGADVANMDLGQMLSTIGELGADLRRLLVDPLQPPEDLVVKASAFGEQMQAPADHPLPAPATSDEIQAAEAALGAELPPLLRRLYTEVADGGFGPGYGLLGVGASGWTDDHGRGLVASTAAMREGSEHVDGDGWRWPATLLTIAHLGDVVYACVDAARPGVPVLEYDPSDLDWDEDGYPVDEGEALVEVRASLADWLADWLGSPSAAERQAAVLVPGSVDVRDQLRHGWSFMSREERLELGITDWHYEHGEIPDSWK